MLHIAICFDFRIFLILKSLTCTSSNVVYLAECVLCGLQGVGSTARLANYKSHIKHKRRTCNITNHYNNSFKLALRLYETRMAPSGKIFLSCSSLSKTEQCLLKFFQISGALGLNLVTKTQELRQTLRLLVHASSRVIAPTTSKALLTCALS